MNKELRRQIDSYINDMKNMGYDLTNMFLVINAKKYSNEIFTYRGLSVIYNENMNTDFEFKEYKNREYKERKDYREFREIKNRRFSKGGIK